MSVRRLRPDSDRCLGEQLPHQLANQTRAPLPAPGPCGSPALISTCSKAGCYAVLASLSGRYPPLEGRSPTCYSPVCHSTHPLRDFRVRLACVRHAASVDSEPGSNSHVKFAGCRLPMHARLKGSRSIRAPTAQLINARPIWLLRCFNPFVYVMVCRQSPSHGLTIPIDRFCGPTR